MKNLYQNVRSFLRMLFGAPIIHWKGVIPNIQTTGAACFDLVAAHNCIVHKGHVTVVTTKHMVEVPKGYALEVLSRSGLAASGVFVVNAPGIVDSDYRGHIKVILSSIFLDSFSIKEGDRIAQARIVRCLPAAHVLVDNLSTTARGENGLGSTGV